ncbi:hypothetical protein [Baaleninema simplex]|uniref:hypothetical protein n=1 Tax=Baaleninema simplex TaxID=2862350 RepID=UPI000344F612|nr:hypothetical protein [Baaleninema simplex]
MTTVAERTNVNPSKCPTEHQEGRASNFKYRNNRVDRSRSTAIPQAICYMRTQGENWPGNSTSDTQVEAYISLAVDIMRARDPRAIVALKDFLTVLPTPSTLELVLKQAVYRLGDLDRPACRWILQHGDLLMPELDLQEVARQWAIEVLTRDDRSCDRDYWFDRSGRLHLSDAAKIQLQQMASGVGGLMLEEIFDIPNDGDPTSDID